MAAAITQPLLSLSKPKPSSLFKPLPATAKILPRPNLKKQSLQLVRSVANDFDLIPVKIDDQPDGVVFAEREADPAEVGGFGTERLSFEGAAGFLSAASGDGSSEEEMERLSDRAINATIVLAAGSFAITKLLTIDHDYWHGWTLFEIVRYLPQHNWSAYEEALKTNPVLAKMVISGVVYSVGDWIAQCYEGKPLFEFDRARMFRSGLLGFTLHGSLSHYYYQFCEALFPFHDWWVVPVKVIFDQTAWSAVWNSIYYVLLGFLRFESPVTVFSELRATFWPMLTAGWKLWPFAHLITYGVIPVEQRLLWVDCVELIWVTILSTYSNEKSEARISEAPVEVNASLPLSNGPSEE
ncbi:protein SYM1-like isoform X2 [Salvia miltiorrhiza]|uniref:protein SYM1-like isoform X2 n=1 Tax=Salvia miltiorrhiza TaxID=226208 RepID=UPI0025ACFA55|nr:protein SYM1-like isoform X2 [Salvia miltiorrhiza]